jgi:hypothetical protein
MLRKAINYTNDIQIKSDILHNLSLVIYYECKSHNKRIDLDIKLQEQKDKQKELIKSSPHGEQDRIVRKFSDRETKIIAKEQREFEELKMFEDENKNSYYKKLAKLIGSEYKEKSKLFALYSKMSHEENKSKPDQGIIEETLLKSK